MSVLGILNWLAVAFTLLAGVACVLILLWLMLFWWTL